MDLRTDEINQFISKGAPVLVRKVNSLLLNYNLTVLTKMAEYKINIQPGL